MKWVLGLETEQRQIGAGLYASWLAEQTEKFGRSALELMQLRSAVDPAEPNFALAEEGGVYPSSDDQANHLNLLRDHPPDVEERILAALRAKTSGTAPIGLIIPRTAAREGLHIARIHHLTRRIAMQWDSPFLVVPPHLEHDDIGTGAVVAATDLGPSSVEACKVAMEFCQAIGRPLTVVYVARVGEFLIESGDASPGNGEPHLWTEDNSMHPFRRLNAWLDENGIVADSLDLLVGSAYEELVEYASLEEPPLLVVGRRHMSAEARSEIRSTSMQLCSRLSCPVMVVPEREQPQASQRAAA